MSSPLLGDIEQQAPAWPTEWHIAFRRSSKLWWLALMPARYRHCLCFAWIEKIQAWMIVEYARQGGSMVTYVRGGEDLKFLEAIASGWTILKVVTGTGSRRFPGLYCVSLSVQVTGVPSCALSVDGFFRDCLAHGAEIVLRDEEETFEIPPVIFGGKDKGYFNEWL